MKVLVDRLPFHRGVHVRPDERDRAARDAAALVGDLDGDVLLALDDDDLDRWEGVGVFGGDAEAFNDGAEGVFEQLKDDVGEMARDVGEGQGGGTDELHGGALEHGVVFFADEARVFDRFFYDVVYVLRVVLRKERHERKHWEDARLGCRLFPHSLDGPAACSMQCLCSY